MQSKGKTIMPMMHHSHEEESERRYDPETLRKVTALAARLQSERQEYLTASEMEAIGAEVGLEPEFIRQALAQHTEQAALAEKQAQEEREQETQLAQSLQTTQQIQTQSVQQVNEVRSSKVEFLAAVMALTLPVFWGALAYMSKFSPGLMTLFTLISPAPLTALMGFLSGRKSVGITSALMMVLALAPTFPYLFFSNLMRDQIDPGMYFGAMFAYALFATPMIASLGALGATLRERFFPQGIERQQQQVTRNVSRSEVLHTMQAIQTQMEGRSQHRACLSVDVVSPTEMRFGQAAPMVEYTFGQYRRWVDEVARACGGELHSGVGDSMLFLFPTDAQAVRVARRLQEGVPSFNAALNRLPMPFRLRCGVSGGEMMEGGNLALQHLHSPMLDRAAMLQHRSEPGDIVVSGEVAASALVELEHLAPLSEPVFGAPAFSWQAGHRQRNAIN
ncbi:MAG TPA: hypothetical protein VKU00_34070 [Chthonomonadaceae bacterium]|nr:hypothetical protein [Chthonomonadaceae bacterium]